MKNRTLLLSLLFWSLFLRMPMGAIALAQAPTPESVVVAHWGQEKILLYLPLYVAMEEGYFAEEGLNVRLRFSGNDDQVFASVMSGEAQFGVGDPAFAAIARERGFPGKVIALLVERIGLSGYTKRGDLQIIESEKMLSGLRIGSFPAPSTTYTLLREIVDRFPKALPPPQIVQLAIGAQAAGLAAGGVDIATDLEPAVSVAEANGHRVIFSLDRFSKPLAITGLSTTDKMIADRRTVAQGMVHGLNRGLQALAISPELGIRVAKKCFPNIPPEIVARAVRRMLDLHVYPGDARVPDDLWLRTLEMRVASKELQDKTGGMEVVERSFAEAALNRKSDR